MTATVTDSGASTPQKNTAETSGKTAYLIPVASAGASFVFQTQNPQLMDTTGDGLVTVADIGLSVSEAYLSSVVPSNGVFTLQLGTNVSTPTSFTVTYWSERVDTLPVTITSTSDATGFALTLKETAADSAVFTATFETGAKTVTTNATNPTAGARPDIKVVDKDVVTATYTDEAPLTIVRDTIRVDGIGPAITQLSPGHNAFEQTFSSVFEARVTDIDSGVNVASIKFHLDADGNDTFAEPGTILLPDPLMTTVLSDGVIVRVRVPSSSSDGLRSWYVTASDIAGGTGRSDSVAGTAGYQNHVFTSDESAPQIVSVVAGESYDVASKTIKTGSRTTIHVVFSEKISVPSIVVGGFRLNGAPVASVQTYTDLPNDLFLIVETYPTVGPVVLLIDSGSITDLAGITTELVPITVVDKIDPVLTINFDRTATNSLVNIRVSSDEKLTANPSITVNGLTRGIPTKIGELEWEYVFDVATLTGLDTGQGPKTVGAFGFDESNNLGEAVQAKFELDTTPAAPVLTPTGITTVTEAFPAITAVFPTEAGEYVGDTHNRVSLILATLNGRPVAPLMVTPDGVSWTLNAVDVNPDGYENGTHVFEIIAVDTAGNTHELARTVFVVDAPPPPEPVIEPVLEDEESVPAEEAAPEGDQLSEDSDAIIETGPVAEQNPEDATVIPAVDDTTEEPAAIEESVIIEGEDEPAIDVRVEEQTPASDEEILVTDPVADVVPVADVDAVVPDDGVEPNIDPVFDREAELAALDGEGDNAATSTEETGGAIFGCNLPLGNTNVVGGEYALLGIGILGLALRRPAGVLREMLFPVSAE